MIASMMAVQLWLCARENISNSCNLSPYQIYFQIELSGNKIGRWRYSNFNISFERKFKSIAKIRLQILYILLDPWNILTESNQQSAILEYWGYVPYVTSGSTKFLSRHKGAGNMSLWISFLVSILNFKRNKNGLKNFLFLLRNLARS